MARMWMCAGALFVQGLTACAGADDPDEREGTGEGEGEGDEGRAALCAEPAVLNFGPARVGTESAALAITVTNCGDAESGILLSSASGDYVLATADCARVPVGSSCTLGVRFAPLAVGARAGEVVVVDSTTDDTRITIALAGTGLVGPRVVLSDSSLSFGGVVVDTQSPPLVLTVSNDGDTVADVIDVVLGGADASDFLVIGDACADAPLAAGATCAIDVVFAPLAPRPLAATLAVGDAVAALSGTGLADARLALSPATSEFGAVDVGTVGERELFVTNVGDVDSGPLAVVLEGAGAAEFVISGFDCEGAVLAPGAGCTVFIRFAPASFGAREASLRASATPGGEGSASLSGTGVLSDGLVFDPAAADLGPVELGQSAAPADFTITNGGGLPVPLLGTSISGVDAAQFVVQADTCAHATLAAGASCIVSIVFAPTSTGAASASLLADVADGSQCVAALEGTGVPAPPILVSPTGLDFGSFPTLHTSEADVVDVTNPSSGTVGTPSAVLGGTNASQFEVVDTTCVAPLGPSESCRFTVRYAPTSEGTHVATLTISASDGGSAVVVVAGIAVPFDGLSFSGPTGYAGGDVVVGAVSANIGVITLTNVAAIETGVIDTRLIGTGAASFAIVDEDCTTLLPGATCSVSVRFEPQAPAGPKVAQLQVSTAPVTLVSQDFTGNALAP